jgi:hypothetical protein
MGGEGSQKLLLRRGIHSSPGRQRASGSAQAQHFIASVKRQLTFPQIAARKFPSPVRWWLTVSASECSIDSGR